MKRALAFFVAISVILCVFQLRHTSAQSPQKMSYQAVIRNSSNQLITNQAIGMQISILQGSLTGATVFVETQNPTTNANGLVSIEIGGGTVISGNLSAVNWAVGPYFIKTETDPTGGTNHTITGTSQLLSVPYALHSKTAETVTLAVSETGDTLFLGSKQFVIIPGISIANAKPETVENFMDTNRPFFEYNESDNQYVLMPWNYNKVANINRDYPLVIFLHGSGGAGSISFLNYIGYDYPEDNKVDSVAYHFQKEHPCFTLVPQTSGEWNNDSLIKQVEEFKSKYRIDESRIYLIGYSMGGSGSWSFANAYNNYNGHLFAGIIRLAGQSQTQVTDDIAENTAMWLQIGLNDLELRIDVTREAYNFLSQYHNNPQETTEAVPIYGYKGNTYSLILNGEDFIKRTEYEGIGHGINVFPFEDPYLIKWLFRQKL